MKAGPKAVPASNRISEHHAVEFAARERDQHTAARLVASRATDVEDCRELLGMLGLRGAANLPVIDPPPRD